MTYVIFQQSPLLDDKTRKVLHPFKFKQTLKQIKCSHLLFSDPPPTPDFQSPAFQPNFTFCCFHLSLPLLPLHSFQQRYKIDLLPLTKHTGYKIIFKMKSFMFKEHPNYQRRVSQSVLCLLNLKSSTSGILGDRMLLLKKLHIETCIKYKEEGKANMYFVSITCQALTFKNLSKRSGPFS